MTAHVDSGKRRTLLYEWFERLRADPAPLVVPVDGEIAVAAGHLRARRERVGQTSRAGRHAHCGECFDQRIHLGDA